MSRGFTLIEMLAVVTVFAMIAGISYGVLGVAGDGFLRLQAMRDAQEASSWMGRLLRQDCGMMSGSEVKNTRPLRLNGDTRGGSNFDELWLLVREPGKPGITEVYYHMDANGEQLVRESRLLWGTAAPQRMQLGKVQSFRVEAMDAGGQWQNRWATEGVFIWPRALRVTVADAMNQQTSWILPTPMGLL